jgi:hypothetical protein
MIRSDVSFNSPHVRPQSDRADDMLPKGTVFRWNPYVSTPISPPSHGGAPGPMNRHSVIGAPVSIVSSRAEVVAAADFQLTPLANHDSPEFGGPTSPQPEEFASVFAVADPAAEVKTEPTVIVVSPTLSLSSDSADVLERALVALIEEPRDASIRERVLALRQSEANRLYAYLARHPEVADLLCTQHRGKLLSDVIEAAAESLDNSDLFRWVLNNISTYAMHQSGCIAITRVYDVVPAVLRGLIDDWVALHFVDLASDKFGNYVVQRVIQGGDAAILEAISRQLRSRGVVAALTTSKAGSHVVERFVQAAPLTAALPVCRQLLLADPALVVSLADDRYGNYVVQACLKKVFEAQRTLPADADARLLDDVASLAARVTEAIPPLVAQTKNAANIHRSMGLRAPLAAGAASGPEQDGATSPGASGKGPRGGAPPADASRSTSTSLDASGSLPIQSGADQGRPAGGSRLSASALRRGGRGRGR